MIRSRDNHWASNSSCARAWLCILLLLFVCHGRDGAREPRMSHHGSNTQGKMKDTSMLCSSRPWGWRKMDTVIVTPSVTGVTGHLTNGHGRDHEPGGINPLVTSVTELQGVGHPVSHGRDWSPGRTTSNFVFPYFNLCNVIAIHVTLSLFWYRLTCFNTRHA